MGISQLSLTNFRGLKSTTLDFHSDINFIMGNNGSGKTSLLEAIYVTSQGCSFRTHQLKQCVNHHSNQLLLFSKFTQHTVGLSQSDKKLEIKVNREAVKKRSQLASKTPISIIDSDSFKLVTGSPELRRNYLDWCLFHVEQDFPKHWANYKHAIKQRNSILKSRKNLETLKYWDEYLIEPSINIQILRKKYLDIISNQLKDNFKNLLGELRLCLEYQQGWPENKTLEQSMIESQAKDRKTGFTNYGVHRDNIKLTTGGKPITQVLSRGQLKRLCISLKLALLDIVNSHTEPTIILLVDDINSELDSDSQKIVFNQIFKMDIQVFVTNIDNVFSDPQNGKEYKLFHVEHGIITSRKKEL